MVFSFSMRPEWPSLVWIAECVAGSEEVSISHGNLVETNSSFFCEAVWDGEFASGDFDKTDIVSGSGGRIRGSKITFVSPGSTCDRLVFTQQQDRFWISNSLICLLHTTRACVPLANRHYHDDFFSAAHGLNRYKKLLATSGGDVRLVYYHNVIWDGDKLSIVEKERIVRDFSSYSRYTGFLQRTMNLFAVNMRDTSRSFPFSLITSISSGYDSTAVATLARNAGCKDALSFTRSDAVNPDDGRRVAEVLGLHQHIISRDAWIERQDAMESFFMAVDGKGEDRYYASADKLLHRRVLTSGYHGDKIWGKQPKDQSDQIVRGDTSGLSLTEFRLKAGFIHCPVPFWGVQQIKDVVRLSRSDEMKDWDLPNWYSRPICRRIVEEAGVAREDFGQVKSMASVQNHDGEHFLSNSSTADYLKWLKAHRWELVKAARFPVIISPKIDNTICTAVCGINRQALKLRKFINRRDALWRFRKNRPLEFLTSLQLRVGPLYLRRYQFPWAMDKAQENFTERAGRT